MSISCNLRYILLLAACCCSPTLSGSDEGTLFSYAEWGEVAKNFDCDQDFILMADGKKVCGTVEKLPPIDFSFGRVTFAVSEVSSVSLVDRGGKRYVQYITQSGHSYFGPVVQASFQFYVKEPTNKNPEHVVRKEVAPSQITFMILKKRPETRTYSTSLFTLSLKDGQQIPVALAQQSIVVTDGWQEKKLHPQDIIEITFEGGVQGTVVQGDIRDNLGFVFVKDRFLAVQTPKIEGLIKLPWDRIALLQAGQNGFKYEPERASSHLVGSAVYLPVPSLVHTEKKETPVAGVHVSEPDSLGNMQGKELSEAAGFLTVEPQAIAALDEIGNELMSEPKALFDAKEETQWAMEIDFTDTNPIEEIAEADPQTDSTDWQQLTETALFEHVPKVEAEPESFQLASDDDELTEEDKEDLALLLAEVEEEDEELETLYEHEERDSARKVDLLIGESENDEEGEKALIESLLSD